MNLLPCPKCLRHARTSEPACPFCKAPLPSDFAARSPKGGMWRWHAVTAGALASGVSMADCSSQDLYGAPCLVDAGCPPFSVDAGADDARTADAGGRDAARDARRDSASRDADQDAAEAIEDASLTDGAKDGPTGD